ncbi:MAG: cell division protein SepF [Propionibacteriaceae bacterium]|jgi:cell division inhibitor SepF|nr:cell division protein SepF [Propionibacteriaceae bacterium]
MADRLSRVAAFILGPSAHAEDDEFVIEGEQSSADDETTDVVDIETAKASGRERPAAIRQGSVVTSLDQRRRSQATRTLAMSEIAHVRPYSFSEAAKIGESYKEGVPIILNLTTTDEKQAQKLIDFASGMAFVTDGKLERITSRVFMVIPAAVRLTDADKDQLSSSGAYDSYE